MLRAWIDQGANWAGTRLAHWSFQKIQRPAAPAVRNRAWVRNPIDNFILARLETEKIAPSPEAGKITLLRRVSLDLTGLPPTPDEVDCVPQRQPPRRLRAPGGPAARFAALRREVGALLARPGALRR